MAYNNPNVITRALLRVGHRCEICSADIYTFPGERPKFHIHSALTLHAIEDPRDSSRFIATSVPYAHRTLKGRSRRKADYLVWTLGRPDDAFALCQRCHREIHDFAKNLVGPREYKNMPPKVMDEVTMSFFLGIDLITP